MTRDEINNLTAGPELDALVAEKVLGWKVLGTKQAWRPEGDWSMTPGDGAERPVYLRHCICDIKEPGDDQIWQWTYGFTELGGHGPQCLAVVPCFSEEMTPALEVLDKVVNDHIPDTAGFSLNGIFPGSGDSTAWSVSFADFWSGERFTAHGDTPAEAVCKAALMVVCKPTPCPTEAK
jgi:hypothetical protein